MRWPIYLALKQLFPSGKRLPLFTVLSSLGVALGVTVLYVTLSVMGGFGDEIRRMILDTTGEVQILARQSGESIREPDRAIELAKQLPEVAAATPFADGMAMVLYRNVPAFPAVHGVDPTTVNDVIPVRRFVKLGSFDDLDDDSVILSAQLARSVGADCSAATKSSCRGSSRSSASTKWGTPSSMPAS